MRHPRRHEVEHFAVELQLVVQRADRRDRIGVDVRDKPRRRIEVGISRRV
jgi:hypothetical protein